MFVIDGQVQLIVHLANSNKHNLLIGLRKGPDLVFTLATRTHPSCLFGNTSKTLPSGQRHLGDESSTTKTISPTVRLRRKLRHFIRSCNKGRYSLVHLFQKTSERYCTCFHRLFGCIDLLSKTFQEENWDQRAKEVDGLASRLVSRLDHQKFL